MRYLAIALLLLTSCATTIPYRVEDLRVRETVDIQRGEYQGCTVEIKNVQTMAMNHHGSMSDIELILGIVECPNSTEYDYEKLKYVPFEDVRVDRRQIREREPHGAFAF